MKRTWLEQVHRSIQTSHLLPKGGRIVVAVSGGADSVALLHALHSLQVTERYWLHIIHVDHALRTTSHEDAAFVQALGKRWHIPVTIERHDVAARCAEAGWSLEDGARRIRYDCFLSVARRHSASHVALAHTADDQAETVLMRLMRGTGLMGLGAIPIQRQLDEAVEVVRPLLDVWRRDIVDYLHAHRLTYRDDATNQDQRFVRNRIRHQLIPLLEREYNPEIKGALTQLAEQSRWDYSYLQAAAERQWKRLTKISQAHQVAITIRPFLRQPKALQRQLLRRAIQRLRGDLTRFEFRHWLEAERLFRERPVGTRLDLPGGLQLTREQDRVVCQVLNASPV